MRASRSVAILTCGLVLVALGACQQAPLGVRASSRPGGEKSLAHSPSPAAEEEPDPVASRTAKPVASPQAVASTAAEPQRLLRPPGAVSVLSGRVAVDASYLIGQNAGNLVSDAGSQLVVAGGGTVLSNNGASFVTSASGTLIAGNTGNLISNNGGALIGDKGSGLIGNNAGSYRLQADAPLAVGTVLPAVGMAVSVVSLATGERLPLGLDGKGQPVYEVLTNLSGGYELYVPASETGGVVVQARVPATENRKLAYELIVSADQREHRVIDEDTALVTAYMKQACTQRIASVLTRPIEDTMSQITQTWEAPEELKALLASQMQELRTEGDAVGLDKAEPKRLLAVAERAVLAGIAHVDFDKVITRPEFVNAVGKVPEEPTVAAIVQILRDFREPSALKLAADPDYFTHRPYVEAADACKAPADHYRFEKASDTGEFVVREYFNQVDDQIQFTIGAIMDDLGTRYGHTDANGTPVDQSIRLNAAASSIMVTLMQSLATDAESKAAAIAVIRAYRPDAPGPFPTVLPSPCLIWLPEGIDRHLHVSPTPAVP